MSKQQAANQKVTATKKPEASKPLAQAFLTKDENVSAVLSNPLSSQSVGSVKDKEIAQRCLSIIKNSNGSYADAAKSLPDNCHIFLAQALRHPTAILAMLVEEGIEEAMADFGKDKSAIFSKPVSFQAFLRVYLSNGSALVTAHANRDAILELARHAVGEDGKKSTQKAK